MSAMGVKFGVLCAFTLTVKSSVVAHCPPSGVNVYVVVDVLSTAGDQVPEMLFVLVAGKLNASPLQMSAMGVKLGVLCAFTLTVKSSVVAH
jgi:hypothetical protein